jgi:sugar phosphate isomerase/epimerase
MKRQTFIRQSLALIPTLFFENSLFEKEDSKKKTKIGLQLYTVRNEMMTNPEKTLAQVAKIGYKTVEAANYGDGKIYGRTPRDFRKILIHEGLKMPSGHVDTGQEDPAKKGTLINNFDQALEDAATLGQKYINCGWLSPSERKTLDDYKYIAELFNKSGEKAKSYGLQFCYHNHDFEFQPIHNIVPYDLLLRECDDELVKMEIDFYWTTKAGVDALKLFDQYPSRFPLWHIKDMPKDNINGFAEVGKGKINFAAFFAAKEKAGLDYFYIEQDKCEPRKPMESIAISYQYFKINVL